MDIAQKLYENGKITYMRTDSTYIADDSKDKLKEYVSDKFGSKILSQSKTKEG